jgi:hypothetical protein
VSAEEGEILIRCMRGAAVYCEMCLEDQVQQAEEEAGERAEREALDDVRDVLGLTRPRQIGPIDPVDRDKILGDVFALVKRDGDRLHSIGLLDSEGEGR